jgi:hypothetical protein
VSGAGPGPPSAQSPFARRGRYPRRGGVAHLLGRRYPPVLATTDSRASPVPSRRLRVLYGGSLPVAVSPGWGRDLPDVISADLSPDAWTPTPAAPKVPVLVSSLGASAFPPLGRGRRLTTSVQRLPYGLDFGAVVIRCCSGLRVCLPSRSLPPQGLCGLLGGQDVDVWAHSRVVTFPESRPASRLNRAIDGVGTRTPPDPQPCRLLP